MSDKTTDGGQKPVNSGAGVWIWLLAAAIGFGAVYVTTRPSDNAPVKLSAAETTPKPGASQGDPPSSSKLTAFVMRKSPEPMPAMTFLDGKGEPVTLAQFKGKTILLNLWATWCAPCREEMPSLDRLQKALGGDKFEVVALSLDRQGLEGSRKFLADVKADSLNLYVDPSAKQGTNLKLIGMPTTLLIDKDGRELGRLAGPAEWDSTDAKKLIEAAMK